MYQVKQKININPVIILISPIVSSLLAIMYGNYVTKKWFLIISLTIFGSIITLDSNVDGARHLENAESHYFDLSISQFLDELVSIIMLNPSDETNDDVYIHIVSFVCVGLLAAPWLFFTVVSFVYAYFYCNSILQVLKKFNIRSVGLLPLGIILLFILYKGPEGINTVRTWTGLWVLFYFSFRFFEERKIKYLLLSFTAPLIHISYMVMAIPVWLVMIFGLRKKLFTAIFLISFFSAPQTEFIQPFLGQADLFQNKYDAYLVEDVDQFYQNPKLENYAWYLRTTKTGSQNQANLIVIFYLILSGFYFRRMSQIEAGLFSIGLITLSLSNVTEMFFALHNRTALIGAVFCLASLVMMLTGDVFKGQKGIRLWFKNLSLVGFLVLSTPYVLLKIAQLSTFTSFYMISLPILPFLSPDLNFSLREMLGFFT